MTEDAASLSLRDAIERVEIYIKGAMKPQNIAEAASEGPWDRGRRAGLQEALNSLHHELANVLARLPVEGETPREALIAARNNIMSAITSLRGGYATVMDGCDEAIAELDIAIGKAFMAASQPAETRWQPIASAPKFPPVLLQDGKSPEWTCQSCGGDMLFCGCSKKASEDDDTFNGWTPAFIVWIVRRGTSLPMTIDSIWTEKEPAEKRAALLGEPWFAGPYSHLAPPTEKGADQ